MQVLHRNRSVRKFVRSVKQRVNNAEQRGAVCIPETTVERNTSLPIKRAVHLQKMRSLLRRADKAEAQKKYDEAEKLYIQALTIFPDAFEAQAQLARLYLQTNRESKAVAIYQQLIQEHDNVSYYSNLGLAHFRLGQFTEACDFYNRALLKDPSSPDRCSALGRAYIAADKIEKAIPLLKKAVERMPRDTELLSDLASCYLHCGDSANARIIYSQINKLEPYNESVKQKLKELRIKES